MLILIYTLQAILSAFFLVSCAHHHKDIEHHHHKSCEKNCKLHHEKGEMFDKHCAQSISEGDLHVKGNDDYKIVHGGETYYFSSKEKKDKFQNDVSKNIESAQKNWSAGDRR